MRITETTKYSQIRAFEPLFKEEAIGALKDAAERAYGQMYELTLGAFLQCINGNFEVAVGDIAPDPLALQYFWCKRFNEFAEEFAKNLQNLQIPQSIESKRAADGLPKQTIAESLLTFTRAYFGLPSFKAAEQITIGEVLIAKRDAYITARYQHNLHKIQLQKYKTHNKK